MTESAVETAEVIAIDPAREAFLQGIEQDHDEDAIKMAMLNAGAKFSNVNKKFKAFSIEAGLDMSRADRDALVAELLEGAVLDTEVGFDEACSIINDKVTGMTPQRAALAVRGYAKKQDPVLEVYKKPKGEGSRSGFQDQYHNWLVAANPFPTRDQAQAYVETQGTKNAVKRLSKYLKDYDFASRIVSKFA